MIIDGVQRIHVTSTHPTKSVHVIPTKYLISITNDENPIVLNDNGSFYNRKHTKPVETLKGNHFNDLKTISITFNARKFVVVDLDAEIPMNLLSRTPFHNVVTFKYVPLDLGGDPPQPPGGVTTTFVQLVVSYFKPFKRPLDYPKYKKD